MAKDWSQYATKKKPSRDWSQYASAPIEPQKVEPHPLLSAAQTASSALSPLGGRNAILKDVLQSLHAEKHGGETGAGMAALTGIATGGQRLAHGMLQPIAENILGETIKRASQDVASEREERYRRAQEAHPLAAETGQIAGQMMASSPFAAALGPAGAALGRVLPGAANALSKTPQFFKYLGNILGGGLGGAVFGGSQYVDPDESRLYNTALGGLTGMAIPAVLQTASGIGSLGSAFSKTHPAQKFVEKVLSKGAKNKEAASLIYEGIDKEAQAAGINKIPFEGINMEKLKTLLTPKQFKNVEKLMTKGDTKSAEKASSYLENVIKRAEKQKSESKIILPEHLKETNNTAAELQGAKESIDKAIKQKTGDIDFDEIIKFTSSDENEALRNYMKNPSFENARKADSSLGNVIRDLLKAKKTRGLNDAEKRILPEAMKKRTALKSSIDKRLNDVGRPDLVDALHQANKGYKKNVLTYERNVPINQYKEGELTAEDFIKALTRNKKFKALQGMEEFPELYKMEALKKTGYNFLPALGLAYGAGQFRGR